MLMLRNPTIMSINHQINNPENYPKYTQIEAPKDLAITPEVAAADVIVTKVRNYLDDLAYVQSLSDAMADERPLDSNEASDENGQGGYINLIGDGKTMPYSLDARIIGNSEGFEKEDVIINYFPPEIMHSFSTQPEFDTVLELESTSSSQDGPDDEYIACHYRITADGSIWDYESDQNNPQKISDLKTIGEVADTFDLVIEDLAKTPKPAK